VSKLKSSVNIVKIGGMVDSFLQCIAIVFIPITSYGIGGISLSKLALAISLVYLLIKQILKRKLIVNQSIIILFFITSYILLSSLVSLNFSFRYFAPLLIITYFSFLNVPPSTFIKYCCLCSAILLSFIIVGIVTSTQGILFFIIVVLPASAISGGGTEASVIFRDSISWFSEGLKVVGVDALVLFISIWNSKNSICKSMFLFICTVVIVLSLSRTVWVVYGLIMILFLIKNKPSFTSLTKWTTAILIGIFFIGDILYDVLKNRIEATFDKRDVGLSSREYLLQEVLQRFDISVWGAGAGSVHDYLNRTNTLFNVNNVHNVYAETLIDLGIVGITCLIGVLFYLGWTLKESIAFYFILSISIIAIALLSPYAYSFWVAVGHAIFWGKHKQRIGRL
jgi:hypothetical protein